MCVVLTLEGIAYSTERLKKKSLTSIAFVHFHDLYEQIKRSLIKRAVCIKEILFYKYLATEM